ncbi:MAG: NTPase [Caldisericia bacterium]
MKIFITGESGVGKTTLIKEISDILIKREFKISGFITTDFILKGKRIGFNIVDINTKEERIFASKNIKLDFKFGSYYLNIKNLDEIFNKVLKRNYEILIIDEIGKMEFYSENFKEKIDNLMKSETKILATLHRDFVEKYKIYGNIFILTKENKEKIKNEILKIF